MDTAHFSAPLTEADRTIPFSVFVLVHRERVAGSTQLRSTLRWTSGRGSSQARILLHLEFGFFR